jgi:integrase/recombinase XerD
VATEQLTLRALKPSPLNIFLDAFLLDRAAARCTPKTLTHYRYTVGSFINWLLGEGVRDIQSITPHHIRAYLVNLQRHGLKDTTQHAHARGIKAWLNWLVSEDDLELSPMRKVTMPKLEKRVPAPFTVEDVQELLAACDRKTAKGSRDYALVLMLLDTGLRASELLSLRVGDVDMRSGVIVVMGKGQKQRTVRAGNRARSGIMRMIAARGEISPGDPLWIAYDLERHETGKLSFYGLESVLKRLGRKAGVQPCGPHRFRRTFALWCLRDGMDLHSLRMLMGHSSLAVLQRYLALATEDVERAHAAHSPADRLLGKV